MDKYKFNIKDIAFIIHSQLGIQNHPHLFPHISSTLLPDHHLIISKTSQLKVYDVFNDLGHKSTTKSPDGQKKITLHFVYAVTDDSRYKSQVVAGGHLINTPAESVYTGVVSLCGVHIIVFLAENAHSEATTQEKVYVIAGPEFNELEDHIFAIFKALYSLQPTASRLWDYAGMKDLQMYSVIQDSYLALLSRTFG